MIRLVRLLSGESPRSYPKSTSEESREVPVADQATPAYVQEAVAALDPKQPSFATDSVDLILETARQEHASDLHLQPSSAGLEVRWRLDGVLHPLAVFPGRFGPNLVARLKVLAELLTYRTDLPQEGRIRTAPGTPETRVSTFPTLHGERAVVRLFADPKNLRTLDDLGMPVDVLQELESIRTATAGLVIICGPAGSGKTTTLYACLRAIAENALGRRCIATLEDPIEAALPGVVQSQVNPTVGFTLQAGLRSMLRQDPEVIAVGEIRDAETAEIAFQAALTGHLVLTTFHAGTASEAIGRLADMGIEPFVLRSALRTILAQRLIRKSCRDCINLEKFGCEKCRFTSYRGRAPIVELLDPRQAPIAAAILRRADVSSLEEAGRASGMVTLSERAREEVRQRRTRLEEVTRVVGVDAILREPHDTLDKL